MGVLNSLMLLSLVHSAAQTKYAGRIPDAAIHQRIIALRGAGQSIKHTANLAGCSESQVKRIWAIHLKQEPGV